MSKKTGIERTIWSNFDVRLENYQDLFDEEYADQQLSESRKLEIVYDYLNCALDDERANLNILLPGRIIAFGDIGRWNGRYPGYRIFSNNIKDILSSECDFVRWYCDSYNCRATMQHHDGTNYLLYRCVKAQCNPESIAQQYLEKPDRRDLILTHYTESLRPYIADVYGWPGKTLRSPIICKESGRSKVC